MTSFFFRPPTQIRSVLPVVGQQCLDGYGGASPLAQRGDTPRARSVATYEAAVEMNPFLHPTRSDCIWLRYCTTSRSLSSLVRSKVKEVLIEVYITT